MIILVLIILYYLRNFLKLNRKKKVFKSKKLITFNKKNLNSWMNLTKQGMTMIVVTHEMGFAKEVADQMIFMDEGMIVEKADTKEFFANPKSERTKLFLSQIL